MAKKKKPTRKKNIEKITPQKEMRRSRKEEVIVLDYKATNDAPIRLDKNQRWPSKPSEHLEQRRKIFKTYLENELDYGHKDMALLLLLWDYNLNTDNIMGYTHLSTPLLYQGIINDNLHLLYRAPKTVDSINQQTAENKL